MAVEEICRKMGLPNAAFYKLEEAILCLQAVLKRPVRGQGPPRPYSPRPQLG
jgi:hypothetical protein